MEEKLSNGANIEEYVSHSSLIIDIVKER